MRTSTKIKAVNFVMSSIIYRILFILVADKHCGFRLLQYFIFSLAILSFFLIPFEQTVWASQVAALPVKNNFGSNINRQVKQNPHFADSWQHVSSSDRASFKLSPVTNLPALSNGDTAMPSNAGNFHGAMNGAVDPRTGTASFSLLVASTLYDQGQGKRDLMLAYSGNPSPQGPNSLGLGSHWAFNVGVEQPSTSEVNGHKTTDITTGDGHSFTMESDRDSGGKIYWHPLRHKLGDVTITGMPGDWTISTAGGIREHLQYGYEDWEEGRDGQRVWFYYNRQGPADSTRKLIYICAHPLTTDQLHSPNNACTNNGIHITYQGRDVLINGQQKITLHMKSVLGQSTVQSISMPGLSDDAITHHQQVQLQFSYDDQGDYPWLLKSILQPSGQKTTFLYNKESSHPTLQSQGLPTGFNQAHIPVVTEETNTPAPMYKNIIPEQHVWYQYSAGTADQHNFTGYLSGVSNAPGKDNLFDRADNYTYTVTKDNGLTTTATTYNKYHLPLTITQTDDIHNSLTNQSIATYSPWKGTTFAQLPSTFSLPTQTSKTLYAQTTLGNDSVVSPAKVIQHKKYNSNGQVIWQDDAYGRQTFIQYCPPQGDNHCPKMDPNWPQVTLPEKVLRLPAKQSPAGEQPFITLATSDDPAPAVEVTFDYKLIPIAQPDKNRVYQYQQLLQKQWVHTQQVATIQDGITRFNLFSQQRLTDDAGADTSALAGNWQVADKKVGSLSALAVAGVRSGQPLPELDKTELSSATHYQYNLQQSSPTYGQLTQLSVTRYNPSVPVINGKLLHPGPSVLLAEPPAQTEQVTLKVTHTINPQSQTRTTDIEVAPTQSPSDIKNQTQLMALGDEGGLSLGKTVYSLSTGVKLSTDDTLKTLHTTWTYDLWQRPVKEVVSAGDGGNPQTILWTYLNDTREQAVVKTLPGGVQEKISYAGAGDEQKITATWHRTKAMSNQPLEGASHWIQDSSSVFTKTGQLASKTVYHAKDDDGETIALTSTYGYDTLNRPVWQKSPDGSVNVTVRNDPKMLLISYQVVTDQNNTHEKLSPLLSVVKSNITGKPVARYTFALDPDINVNGKYLYSASLKTTLMAIERQLKSVVHLKTSQSYGLLPLAGQQGLFSFVDSAISAGAWLNKISTQYDGNGRRTALTQPNGVQTHWKWKNGNLAATIAPNGSIIHDSYDIFGNKVARCVQPSDKSTCHALGVRGYDGEGNLAWQTDEYGNRITYTYDADGRLLTMTVPDNKKGSVHVFSYTYNSYAVTSASIDGVIYARWTYNPDTWQLTDKEDTISHLHYTYDDNTGELTCITRSAPEKLKSPAGIHYPAGTIKIKYDRYGQATRYTDLSGNIYSAVHDKYGRILQTYVTFNNQSTPKLLSSITYSPYFNRPVSVINGIGIIRYYIYNDLGNVQSTLDKQNNQVLDQLSYTYDVQTGNILTFTRSNGKDSATQTYTYDKNTNSLTSMVCSATGKSSTPDVLCPRDTDLSGSQLIAPPIIMSQRYQFDDWNNISRVDEQLITAKGKKTGKTSVYTYDTGYNDHYDPHRMTALSTQWQDNVSTFSHAPNAITYDNLGRIIKDAQGNRLHYNVFGNQDEFTNVNTGEHSFYYYDSTGNQIAEQLTDATGKALQQPLYMIYQGDSVSEQVQDDASGKTHRSHEFSGIAHSEDGVLNTWYVNDYKDDTITTYNSSGQKVSDHVYSPYGMDDDLLNTDNQAFLQKRALSAQPPLWQNHRPGFDGQLNDPATGYQFLGGGYRAYNPVYRHFMSHDSYSPFTKIDGYGFGNNNPIMNTDPTGHMPQWLGYALGAVGIVMSIASAVLLPFAAGAAATSAATTAIAASATSITEAGVSGAATGVALGAVGAASGTLQIAGTAMPHNKGLAMTNQILGIASGLSSMQMGGVTIFLGAADAVTGVSKLTSAMVIASGVADSADGLSGEASSDISLGMSVSPNLANKAGLAKAVEYLGYASLGLMVASIATSAVSTFGTFLSLRKNSKKAFVNYLCIDARDATDVGAIKFYAQMRWTEVKAVVSQKAHLEQEVIQILATDKDISIKHAIAVRSDVSKDVLNELANSPDETIRAAVAGNSNTSPETLARLTNDSKARVVVAASGNKNTPQENLESIANGDDRALASLAFVTTRRQKQKTKALPYHPPIEDTRNLDSIRDL